MHFIGTTRITTPWVLSPTARSGAGTGSYSSYISIQGVELYDLTSDIHESNDLAMERPEITADLLEKLNQWRESVGAQMPTVNTEFRCRATDRRESEWENQTRCAAPGIEIQRTPESRIFESRFDLPPRMKPPMNITEVFLIDVRVVWVVAMSAWPSNS